MRINQEIDGILITEDVATRFMEHVDLDGPDGCWLWTGKPTADGYGRFKLSKALNVRVLAHRFAYLLFVGEVLKPTLDHVCHNIDPSCPGGNGCWHRRCVNPAHLKPATRGENSAGSLNSNASKTHCPKGHPYDVITNSPSRGPRRACSICLREQRALAHARRRAKKGKPVYSKPGRPSPKNLIHPKDIQ